MGEIKIKPRTRDLQTWEAEKAAEYPYVCRTILRYPRPDKLNLPYHQIRIPYTQFDYASWRFRQQKDLDDFKSRYADYILAETGQ